MTSIEAHLAQATAHLSRLRDNSHNDTASLYHRTKKAADQLERLEMSRALLPLLQKLTDDTKLLDDAADDGEDGSPTVRQIVQATRTATHLACLLFDGDTNSSSSWQAVQEWYHDLHASTRQSALLLFRNWMNQSSFPEERGCAVLKIVLCASCSDVKPLDGCKLTQRQLGDWRVVSECLIELQVMYDALNVLQQQQQHHHHDVRIQHWRFDIMDEICRPIAHRLRYHFLEETALLLLDENGATSNHSMERLPEWLFRYLRDTTDKVLHVVNDMTPLIRQFAQSTLLHCNTLQQQQAKDRIDTTTAPSSLPLQQTLTSTIQPLIFNPTTYYLREIVRMARHVLRSKSYFSHPDVVGADAREGVAKRAIEQLFLFDEYIRDNNSLDAKDDAQDVSSCEVPRLVDVFLARNEGLFQWWIEEEKIGAVLILRECANTTTRDDGNADLAAVGNKTRHRAEQPPLFPPMSELFISLIHSIRIKASFSADLRSQQHYISSMIGPLSSEYLDMIRTEAALTRKHLLRSKSNTIPSDVDLRINTMEWIGLLNGIHIVISMIHSCNPSQNEVLDRIASSLERVRDAILEEYTSTLVETVIMERAKFASYMMRCPFLLSQSTTFEDHHRRGQREGSLVSNLHMSVDLNDTYHVLSVVVQACRASLKMVEDMMSVPSNDEGQESDVSTTQMLLYGGHSIKDSIAMSVCQKLLDIAIDPQGMTPSIELVGAQQFRFDAMSIVGIFSDLESGTDGIGPVGRVNAASHMMSLGTTQLQQLKETLFELSSQNRIRSIFTGGAAREGEDGMCRLEAESFYSDERLVVEAESMLGAKGFHALALEEALSIINRRV